MQKVLRKLYWRQPAIISIILVLFSLYTFFSSMSAIHTYVQGPVQLENNNELSEFCGEYVSTSFQHAIQKYPVVDTSIQDISVSLDEYYGYIVISEDGNEENIFSVIVPSDDQKIMDLQLVGAELTAEEVEISGTVEELSQTQLMVIEPFLNKESYEDAQVHLLAINTEMVEIEEKERVLRKIIYILGACAAMATIGVSAHVGFAKQLQSYKLKYNENELEKDFKRAHKVTSDLYVGKRFTFYVHNQKIEILDTSKCIWAYCQNSPKASSKVNIVFWTLDGTKLTQRLKKNVWKKYMTQLCSMQPHIVLGYSKEKEQIFHRSSQEFLEKFKEHSMAITQEMLEEEQEEKQFRENE